MALNLYFSKPKCKPSQRFYYRFWYYWLVYKSRIHDSLQIEILQLYNPTIEYASICCHRKRNPHQLKEVFGIRTKLLTLEKKSLPSENNDLIELKRCNLKVNNFVWAWTPPVDDAAQRLVASEGNSMSPTLRLIKRLT